MNWTHERMKWMHRKRRGKIELRVWIVRWDKRDTLLYDIDVTRIKQPGHHHQKEQYYVVCIDVRVAWVEGNSIMLKVTRTRIRTIFLKPWNIHKNVVHFNSSQRTNLNVMLKVNLNIYGRVLKSTSKKTIIWFYRLWSEM